MSFLRKEVKMTKKLKWCSQCKENSVVVRTFSNGKRVEMCINKGCGYKISLPILSSNVVEAPKGIHEEDHSSDYDYHPRHPDDK